MITSPKITNNRNVPLALAVWAVQDNYDVVPNSISATRLLKPIRQQILTHRLPPELRQTTDVSDLLASAFGKALHSATEYAWSDVKRVQEALRVLGYDEHTISNVRINPDPRTLNEYSIPIYIEQRIMRTVDGVTITGKYDMVSEGMLQDYKSTSAYSWVFGSKDEDHAMQGSIYRWIDAAQEYPVITEDVININYLFTDWSKREAAKSSDYPQQRVAQKAIKLMSLDETEHWIRTRLQSINNSLNLPDEELPLCSVEELWFGKSSYKYFADPTKVNGRSTRTFDNLPDAQAEKAARGNKGVIVEVTSEPKRCQYCNVFPVCTQREKYYPTLL